MVTSTTIGTSNWRIATMAYSANLISLDDMFPVFGSRGLGGE